MMEFLSNIKRNETEMNAATWVNHKNMLGEKSQMQMPSIVWFSVIGDTEYGELHSDKVDSGFQGRD